MAQVPFTLRIGPAEHVALKNLSKIEGRPINQLLNEAVRSYLGKPGARERGLETTLASLRKYRKQHAGFQQAIAAFVDAEAGLEDPIEGKFEETAAAHSKPAGPVQYKIRKLLGA
jgi:hypothetical protein